MTKLELQSELKRLQAQQLKARQSEIFLGSSAEEKAEYDARAKRIRELEAQLGAVVLAYDAAAAQRQEWNRRAETDTPLSGAHQPYRSREEESSRAFTDSLKTGQSKPSTKTKQTE